MMETYVYTPETAPDPVVGEGYYTFPVLQYFDGEGKIIFPTAWAEQPFTPPGS
jgi:branched-chain amino acid transport system substrate-binding protein